MLKERFDSAIELISLFLKNYENELDDAQKAQLLTLSAKAHLEIGQLADADDLCDKALLLAETSHNDAAMCFTLNIKAMIENNKSGSQGSNKFLMRVAREAINMPAELRLLTISNIATILKDSGNNDSRKYSEAARKLCYELNFKDFADMI